MFSKKNKTVLSIILMLILSYYANSQTAFVGDQQFWISCTSPSHNIENSYIIKSCPDDTIEIIVSGYYYQNNTTYHQSDSTTNFAVTSSLNYIANHNIIKIIPTGTTNDSIIITAYDLQGDTSKNYIKYIIVSEESETIFDDTYTPFDTICQNNYINIIGNATNNISVTSGRINKNQTTFLPIEYGISYTSILTVYTGLIDTIQSPNDFSVFVNIEHSFLGDLIIELISPSGDTIVLKSFPGGWNTFMGEPIDEQDNYAPGIGYEYHWQNNGTTTMLDAFDSLKYSYNDSTGGLDTNIFYLPPSYSYPANSTITTTQHLIVYQPETPFSTLIGTPLNGDWTLKITDKMSYDSGFIFDWGMILDSFDSTYVFDRISSEGWGNTSGIYSNTGDTISVIPETSGIHSYIYSATDIFGCTADTVINIYARPIPKIELGNDTNICASQSITLDAGNNNMMQIWSDGSSFQTLNIDSTSTGLGDTTINVKIVDEFNCNNFDTISITFTDCTSIKTNNNEIININIFPNPSNGNFTIKGNIINQEINSLQIIDIYGKEVFKENNIKNKQNINYNLDLNNYSSGTYFIKIITNEDSIFLKKIIIN